MPLQSQLRKCQGHEDLEGKKAESPGGNPGTVIPIGVCLEAHGRKVMLPTPGPLAILKQELLPFKETFLSQGRNSHLISHPDTLQRTVTFLLKL